MRYLGDILAWSSELLRVCACWKSRPPALTPVITSHCWWITICFAFSSSRRTFTAKISEQGRYCKSQKPVTPKWEEIGDDRVHLWSGIFVREAPEMGKREQWYWSVLQRWRRAGMRGWARRAAPLRGPDTFRTVASSQESKKPCPQDSTKKTCKERSWDNSELRDEAGGGLDTTSQQHNENSCLNLGVRNSMTKIELGCGTCQKWSPWGWREKENNRESK